MTENVENEETMTSYLYLRSSLKPKEEKRQKNVADYLIRSFMIRNLY